MNNQQRAINEQMIARLMEAPAQPYGEGGYLLRVMELHGRKSGNLIRLPIGVTTTGGKQYLVTSTPTRSWVLNLLATDGVCTLSAGTEQQSYHAEQVGGLEAVGVLRLYVTAVERVRDQYPFAPDSPDEQYFQNLSKVAVFRLIPQTD